MSVTTEITKTDDGELALVVARETGSGTAVVIMPSAFGVPEDLREQMRALAAHARCVVTFDPFARSDPGPADYTDMARVMTRLRGLDRARAEREFRAAARWARTEAGSVVALGICFGGPFAFAAAADGLVDGVVTWHGTGLETHLARASAMMVPMRLHFGGADPFVKPEAVDAIRDAFTGRDDVRILVHAGATHGFSHPASPASYDAEAERQAMASVRELVGLVTRE